MAEEQRCSWHPLVGLSFLQAGRFGIASYHFIEDDCFISYLNAPPQWKLASGASPPERAPFLEPSFNAATRTFTAWVDWSSDVFNGSARWNYCFTFDEHFNSIQSGQVLCFDLEGRLTSVSHYGLDEQGSMGMLYLRSSGPPPSHASEAA